MNKFKAALSATGVIGVVILIFCLIALLRGIFFFIGGLGILWWYSYKHFKN